MAHESRPEICALHHSLANSHISFVGGGVICSRSHQSKPYIRPSTEFLPLAFDPSHFVGHLIGKQIQLAATAVTKRRAWWNEWDSFRAE
jgi:hypothetical protein